mgnify:CR=1 FL=1
MNKELIVEALAKRVESGEITIEQIHEFYREDVEKKLTVVVENT